MLSVGEWWRSAGRNGGRGSRELRQNEQVKSRRRFHLKVGNVGSAELKGGGVTRHGPVTSGGLTGSPTFVYNSYDSKFGLYELDD